LTVARKSRKSKKIKPASVIVGTQVETPSGRRYVVEEVLASRARTPRLCVLRPVKGSSSEGPKRLLLPETLVKTG
jgi:hypothetical protein